MSITFTAREARPASGLILLTMSLGVLIAQIDTSVVNLAVKPIGSDLNGGVTALQWIVDVYNFVYASLLLAAGTLADLYGRRRIFADRKSTRLNSSHLGISYAVFCLKKK